MTSKLKSISLSNRINRSPVLNLPVFGIVQPDASKKLKKKRKRLVALALNALISNSRGAQLSRLVAQFSRWVAPNN